jgi:hypothetical protein
MCKFKLRQGVLSDAKINSMFAEYRPVPLGSNILKRDVYVNQLTQKPVEYSRPISRPKTIMSMTENIANSTSLSVDNSLEIMTLNEFMKIQMKDIGQSGNVPLDETQTELSEATTFLNPDDRY